MKVLKCRNFFLEIEFVTYSTEHDFVQDIIKLNIFIVSSILDPIFPFTPFHIFFGDGLILN